MQIYTLGTSHGHPEPGRACTSILLRVGSANYLIDCGGNMELAMTNLGLKFEELRAVFVTHMHEDHTAALSSVIKRFTVYMRGRHVDIYLPEQAGIDGILAWVNALHIPPTDEQASFTVVAPGKIYRDDNITVTAIPTKHIEEGRFPSYAYIVEAEGKRVLFTGDLCGDLRDYRAAVHERDFDAIVTEMTHYQLADQVDTFIKSHTKKLLFSHLSPRNVTKLPNFIDRFPFPVIIAEDGGCYEV
ncbi:MAG: MBL fold metallo-hydrolase [Clostridia bacterium]|nr:MBL fold metallo-hydrolase [Clostridia bacterium]